MKKSDFWFLSLAALFIIGLSTGWNIWIKTAVILNAVVVLATVVLRAKELYNAGKKN